MSMQETLIIPEEGQPEIISVGIPGPPGPKGDKGDQGDPGSGGGDGGSFYRHVQGTPEQLWYIEHFLGYRPNVAVEDSAGGVQVGAVTYISDNALTIEFSSAFSGYANLS